MATTAVHSNQAVFIPSYVRNPLDAIYKPSEVSGPVFLTASRAKAWLHDKANALASINPEIVEDDRLDVTWKVDGGIERMFTSDDKYHLGTIRASILFIPEPSN